MDTKELIKSWNDTARKALLGKTIKAAALMSPTNAANLGWEHSPHFPSALIVQFTDGTTIYPASDDEGNDVGFMEINTGTEESYASKIKKLAGQKVIAIEYAPEKVKKYGFSSIPVSITVSNGRDTFYHLFPMSDAEGNDAGALFGYDAQDNDISLPVIRQYESGGTLTEERRQKQNTWIAPHINGYYDYVRRSYGKLYPKEGDPTYDNFTYSDWANKIKEVYGITGANRKPYTFLKHLGDIKMFEYRPDTANELERRMASAKVPILQDGGTADESNPTIPVLPETATWDEVKDYLNWLWDSPYNYHIDDDARECIGFTKEQAELLHRNNTIVWTHASDKMGTNIWEVYYKDAFLDEDESVEEHATGGKPGNIAKKHKSLKSAYKEVPETDRQSIADTNTLTPSAQAIADKYRIPHAPFAEYIHYEHIYAGDNGKPIIFTKEEDGMYGKLMGDFLNDGKSDRRAEALTLQELIILFPRLAKPLAHGAKIDPASTMATGGKVELKSNAKAIGKKIAHKLLSMLPKG